MPDAARTAIDAAASTLGAGLPMGVLAEQQTLPSLIAVDGGNVYWLNLGHLSNGDTKIFSPYVGGTIAKCSVAGCDGMPKTLGDVTSYPGRAALAVEHGNVYWATSASGGDYIMSCAVGGFSAPVQFTAATVHAMAADTMNLYWTSGETQLSVCGLSSCVPRALSADSNTGDSGNPRLVADDTAIYWINGRNIWKCGKAGCGIATPAVPASTIFSKSQPFDIAVDNEYIYWSTLDLANPAPIACGGTGQIMRCEKANCMTPVVIVDGLVAPTAVATDGTNVYWSDGGQESCGAAETNTGRIAKCPVTGCNQPTPLIEHVSAASNLALDAFNVYFTTIGADRSTGSVVRVPK